MADIVSSTGRPDGAALPTRRAVASIGIVAACVPLALRRKLPAFAFEQPDPDADLHEACSHFDRLEGDIRPRLDAEPGAFSTATEALLDEQSAWLGRLVDHRAVTLAGVQRRAESLVQWADDVLEPSDLWDRDFMAATLRDLLELPSFGNPGQARGARS